MRYRARSRAPKLMNNFRGTRKSELSADGGRMRATLIKNTLRSRTNSQSGWLPMRIATTADADANAELWRVRSFISPAGLGGRRAVAVARPMQSIRRG